MIEGRVAAVEQAALRVHQAQAGFGFEPADARQRHTGRTAGGQHGLPQRRGSAEQPLVVISTPQHQGQASRRVQWPRAGAPSIACAVRASYLAQVMSLDGSLSIRVNGEHRRVRGGVSIAEMLNDLGVDPLRVAVERNLAIVPRSTFAEVRVEDGDDFEIVHFVGGG